jgi:hypothetical protein
MNDPDVSLPWLQPGWLEEAQDWIIERLSEKGIAASGPIEQVHVRPWSTVLRVPTTGGIFYFKASAPVLAHEPGLAQALITWRPDCMQAVIAVNLERAWMLMPDESPWLRAMVQSTADLSHWEQILPLYAGVQREMISRQAELLGLGIFDRRLAGLAGQFEALLADQDALLVDLPDGLTAEQARRLADLVPRYAEMCAQLAGSGIPETLHHDDFHDGNIFVPGGRYAFSDWGESCLAHPFFTLLVTLRSIAYRLDLAYGAAEHDFLFDQEILHLRDVYLSAWKDYGSLDDLREAFDLAWRVAMVNRALTWHKVVSRLDGQERGKYASSVPGWLQEFLEIMECNHQGR